MYTACISFSICCKTFTATNTLRIPKVFHVGPMPNGRGSFIVMEALKLSGSCSMSELGRQLARMHLAEPAVSLQYLNTRKLCIMRHTTVLPGFLKHVRAGLTAGTHAPSRARGELKSFEQAEVQVGWKAVLWSCFVLIVVTLMPAVAAGLACLLQEPIAKAGKFGLNFGKIWLNIRQDSCIDGSSCACCCCWPGLCAAGP